jgi:hypothetical protein
VLKHSHRLLGRTWRGSDMEIRKTGPKDVALRWVGMPCAISPYFRVAFGAFTAAVLAPFCTKIFHRVINGDCNSTTATYRFSWA